MSSGPSAENERQRQLFELAKLALSNNREIDLRPGEQQSPATSTSWEGSNPAIAPLPGSGASAAVVEGRVTSRGVGSEQSTRLLTNPLPRGLLNAGKLAETSGEANLRRQEINKLPSSHEGERSFRRTDLPTLYDSEQQPQKENPEVILAKEIAEQRRLVTHEARRSGTMGPVVSGLLDNFSPEAFEEIPSTRENRIVTALAESVTNLAEPLLANWTQFGSDNVRDRFSNRLPEELRYDDHRYLISLLARALAAAEVLTSRDPNKARELKENVTAIYYGLLKFYSYPTAKSDLKTTSEAQAANRAPRDFMGKVTLKDEEYDSLKIFADRLFEPQTIRALVDSGLLPADDMKRIIIDSGTQETPQEIKIALAEKDKEGAAGNEEQEVLRGIFNQLIEKEFPRVKRNALPVLQQRFPLYEWTVDGFRETNEDWPAFALIAAEATLVAISRQHELLKRQFEGGGITRQSYETAINSLNHLETTVKELRDECSQILGGSDEITKEVGPWLKKNPYIERRFQASPRVKGAVFTSIYPNQEDNLLPLWLQICNSAFPGCIGYVPASRGENGQEEPAHYDIANLVASFPIDTIIIAALERLQQETAATELVFDIAGIPDDKLPEVMREVITTLYGIDFEPAQHGKFMPGKEENEVRRALDGGVSAYEIFLSAIDFGEAHDVSKEHEGYVMNPWLAGIIYGYLGNRFAHLFALEQRQQQGYAALLAHQPISLGDFNRVYMLADRLNGVGSLPPVKVEREALPSRKEIIEELKQDFTGGNQQHLIKAVVKFFDMVVTRLDDTPAGDERLARRETPEEASVDPSKPTMWIIGSTGVGKTEIVRAVAQRYGLPVVWLQATELQPRSLKGRRVGVALYEELLRIARETDTNIAAVIGEFQKGRYPVIIDEFDKIFTEQREGGDTAGRKQELANELLALTGTGIINLEGPVLPDGERMQISISARYIPVLSMGAMEELQRPAKFRHADKTGDQSYLKDPAALPPISTELLRKIVPDQILGRFGDQIVVIGACSREDFETVLEAQGSRLHPLALLRKAIKSWLRNAKRVEVNEVRVVLTDKAREVIVEWLTESERRIKGYRMMKALANKLEDVVKGMYEEGKWQVGNRQATITIDEEIANKALSTEV